MHSVNPAYTPTRAPSFQQQPMTTVPQVAAALMSATSVSDRNLGGLIVPRRPAWRLELAWCGRFYMVASIALRMTRVTAAAAVTTATAGMATATVAEVHKEHSADEQNPDPVRREEARHRLLLSFSIREAATPPPSVVRVGSPCVATVKSACVLDVGSRPAEPTYGTSVAVSEEISSIHVRFVSKG